MCIFFHTELLFENCEKSEVNLCTMTQPGMAQNTWATWTRQKRHLTKLIVR